MKKLFLFLALGASVAFTSCNKDDDSPNSNDEIVGTWIDATGNYEDIYVFNGDNSGNYVEKENGDVIDEESFTWSKVVDSYVLIYGGDESYNEKYTIGEVDGKKVLLDDESEEAAIKQ